MSCEITCSSDSFCCSQYHGVHKRHTVNSESNYLHSDSQSILRHRNTPRKPTRHDVSNKTDVSVFTGSCNWENLKTLNPTCPMLFDKQTNTVLELQTHAVKKKNSLRMNCGCRHTLNLCVVTLHSLMRRMAFWSINLKKHNDLTVTENILVLHSVGPFIKNSIS